MEFHFLGECNAKTRTGGACQLTGNPQNSRCNLHGGASAEPKTTEGRARIAAAQFKQDSVLKHLWPLSGLEMPRAGPLNVN